MKEIDIRTEKIHLFPTREVPEDYHCHCWYCQEYLGILKRKDGSKYSKLDRKKYYSDSDAKHIAKTPLHMARWCIQEYTKPDDWVLDVTMGAGTTAVEALNHERNVVGIELEFFDVIMNNIHHQRSLLPNHGDNPPSTFLIVQGDARKIKDHLSDFKHKFSLIVNNPPYSGDEQQVGNIKTGKTKSLRYNPKFNNLAFEKENGSYYNTVFDIYAEACKHLKKGGHFCIGVKDMVRNKEPYLIHKYLGNVLNAINCMSYIGMVLLPHYPPTLFMSTYNKRFPYVQVPKYQTIIIFRKEK